MKSETFSVRLPESSARRLRFYAQEEGQTPEAFLAAAGIASIDGSASFLRQFGGTDKEAEVAVEMNTIPPRKSARPIEPRHTYTPEQFAAEVLAGASSAEWVREQIRAGRIRNIGPDVIPGSEVKRFVDGGVTATAGVSATVAAPQAFTVYFPPALADRLRFLSRFRDGATPESYIAEAMVETMQADLDSAAQFYANGDARKEDERAAVECNGGKVPAHATPAPAEEVSHA